MIPTKWYGQCSMVVYSITGKHTVQYNSFDTIQLCEVIFPQYYNKQRVRCDTKQNNTTGLKTTLYCTVCMMDTV